jgi:hypothetical protein
MKNTTLALAIAALMAGCDAEGDEAVTPADVNVLVTTCKANGGMKAAQRVRPMFTGFEWRIDCADGARFVMRAREGAPS